MVSGPIGLSAAIRVHGRGGQGVVTAAELLSVAAFSDGLEAQAVPSFGSERMGAPVVAYCRLSSSPIRTREPVAAPDVVVVVDATLLHHVDVFAGLRPDGYVVLNSSRTAEELGVSELTRRQRPERICVVPATDLARRPAGGARPNVCMLGAFAALTGLVSMQGIERAVRARLAAPVAEANLAAALAAYRMVRQEVGSDA
jgi:pyruvate ferredoxin oxidoreductase gamma subunit